MEYTRKSLVNNGFFVLLGMILLITSGECRRPVHRLQATMPMPIPAMPPQMPMDPETCSLPEAPGPCRAFIPRYHFDITTRSCHEFIWGGCQANANNFQTEEECLGFADLCLRNNQKSAKRMSSTTTPASQTI